MKIVELIGTARKQLSAVTGLPLETTVSVRENGGGAWDISVELLERKAVPDSQDLLATYLASVSAEGDLQSFKRISSRRRMEAVEHCDD